MADISVAMQAAIDAGTTYEVPEGASQIANVELKPNAHIVAPRNAVITGVASDSVLFLTTAAAWNVSISGGLWQTCDKVLSTVGTLSNCFFTDMRISDCVLGFDVGTSVRNIWTRCDFQSFTAGIAVGHTGQSNVNILSNCKFLTGTGVPLVLDNGFANHVDGCQFEDVTKIEVTDQKMTSFSRCYFERRTADVTPDILVSGSSRQIVISACYFATGTAAQPNRVESEGLSQITVLDSCINLRTGGTFAGLSGNSTFESILLRNYLNAIGAGSYVSRLYSSTGQPVTYDIFTGSGFVDEDATIDKQTLVISDLSAAITSVIT